MKLRLRLALVTSMLLTGAVMSLSEGVATAANPLAGKPCYAVGSTTTVNYIKYTCISQSVTTIVKGKRVTTKKLVYNAGVQQPIPPSLPTGNFDTSVDPANLIWQMNFAGAQGSPISNSATDATTRATVQNFNLYWTPVTGSGTYGTGEIENNTTSANNLSLDGSGNLAITAKCTSNCNTSNQPMGRNWTSARIWTQNKVNFQYGQLEARIWMPTGSFNWPAFWMMGSSFSQKDTNPLAGWPYCGELDIAESLQQNSQDQATIHSNIPGMSTDWGNGAGLTQVAPLTQSSMTGGWHNYGILWKPNYIAFILDGVAWAMVTYNPTTKQVMQTAKVNGSTVSTTYGPGTPFTAIGGNWPFNAPFFIILNNAVGGAGATYDKTLTSSAQSASGTMKIQWVRYYLYSGYGAVTLAPH